MSEPGGAGQWKSFLWLLQLAVLQDKVCACASLAAARSARFDFLAWHGHSRHGRHDPQTLIHRLVERLAHAPALLIG
jgi:hypothetical protein